jgi:hypothetical protein
VDTSGNALATEVPVGALKAFTNTEAWWNTLDCPEMIAAMTGDKGGAPPHRFCAMYADLGAMERSEVDMVAMELHDMYASVEAWWNALDCRLMRIAVGDGNTVDMTSPYCAMYADLGAMEKDKVDTSGYALAGMGAVPALPLAGLIALAMLLAGRGAKLRRRA